MMRHSDVPVSISPKLEKALTHAATITFRNIIKFQDYFPRPHSMDGRYHYTYTSTGDEWMRGFWCGLVWLLYELKQESGIRCYGEKLTQTIHQSLKKRGLSYNDIGFMVILSCAADYSFTGSTIAKESIVAAADSLLTKFHRASNILCSRDEELDSNLLSCKISSLLNSQLLFLASGLTNNTKYSEAAQKNIETVLKYNILEDGRTYFYSYFDQKTGNLHPVRQLPGSGVNNHGDQTRGYAWALYGLTCCYAATGNPLYDEYYAKIYQHLTASWNRDHIFFQKIPGSSQNQICDSTSSAIIAASLVEMAKLSKAQPNDYAQSAAVLLEHLIDHYAISSDTNGEGLLTGAYFGSFTKNNIISTTCGDYFYFEALLNHAGLHRSFWHLS